MTETKTKDSSTSSSPSSPYKAPFLHTIAAGGIAGTTEISIMYPTDVVKTRAQLALGKTEGMVSVLQNIFKQEGLGGLYRGILPPILVETPKRAIKFASNEFYKPLFSDKNGKMGQLGAIGAGVSAGCTEAFVVVPFELVKIRLQDKNSKGHYNGTLDAVTKIAKNEGIFAFYKGMESTMWRHALWNGGYFGVIFQVQSLMPKAQSKKGQLFNNFVAGALAGTFGTILNTPADVVKSRIQNSRKTEGGVPKYNWTLPAIRTIAQEEGFRALYKGFVPKVVRLGPGGGILLVVYSFVIEKLRILSGK
eukprot:TRINITY_DN117_c1_g1_i4.p1 TRINITY_DN117_c1_g1~~TRINITY_DN117_c1_g1_i4.p1  ORF type:complete len:306 (-),score=62.80 TRINITY_DN117_c1_g1_i4:1141-2058(-)